MNSALDFIQDYFFVYVWLILTTFVNIVAPMAASTTVTPVIAFYTDPLRAVGIGAFIFFCSGLHRVYLFRNEIFHDKKNIETIKIILPFSMAGAIAGGVVISSLNAKVLAIIVIAASIYYIAKTLIQIYKPGEEKQGTHLGKIIISLLSGFLQGSGMPGSDIRNNYLRTVLTEKSVRGVGSAVSIANFLLTGLIILFHNHLTRNDLIFVATVVPFLIPAQIYGKMFLDKIPDTHAKIIAIAFSLLGVGLLTYKYLL